MEEEGEREAEELELGERLAEGDILADGLTTV